MRVPAAPPDGEHGRDAVVSGDATLRGRPLDAFLGGAVAGLAGGMFGVGGGILLVPILVGRYRLTQHQAHGTSISVLGFTALSAVIVYGLHGNVAWGTALLTGIGSMLLVRYGARLAGRLSSRGLARSFSVFLVVVAARLFWKTPTGMGSSIPPGLATWAFDLFLGGAVGLLAGFMGVGGGILAVPAFTLLLGMPQALAQGTSLAVILLGAPVGAIEHSRQGNVLWRMVPALAVGAALAAPAASWLAQRLPQSVLARGFAVFLLGNAIWSWWRAGRPRPGRGG